MELWRLRAFLEPRGIARGSFLRSGDHEVAFGPTRRYWLDIEEFESRVRESVVPGDSLSPQKVTMLREAVDLYRGDLLEGVYENWALDQRARLRSLFREALERLMRHHAAARDWSGAISYAERLLSADPFLERVHRALMWFHYAQGDRPAALRQYQLCTEFLRRELSVEPMGETRRLFEEIRSERQRTVHPPLPGFTIPGVPASAT
jgi:DNA-binding SARP family transcriptional activator